MRGNESEQARVPAHSIDTREWGGEGGERENKQRKQEYMYMLRKTRQETYTDIHIFLHTYIHAYIYIHITIYMHISIYI